MISLLLGQPPSWLTQPTPWLIYPLIYLLLIPTGLAAFITSTAPAVPFNVFTAYIDGITRGATISALPALIGSSGKTSNWFTTTLLSGIGICGGGWLVQLFGLSLPEWSLGVPSVLNGGLLNTMDFWGGMGVGIVYAALTGDHAEFEPIGNLFASVLPAEMTKGSASSAIVDPKTARAIAVLLLGSLFAARVITKSILSTNTGPNSSKKVKKTNNNFSVKPILLLRQFRRRVPL